MAIWADDVARPEKYPAIIAAGATTIAVAASLLASPDLSGLFGAGLAVLMAAVAAIDARYFIIPNELNAAALALALIAAAATGWPIDATAAIGLVLLRAATLALLFLCLRLAYRLVRKRNGLGLGDVKLAAVAGAWLGWMAMPVAVEIAALMALAAVASRQWLLGRSLKTTNRLPFGLFFAPAIWLAWLLQTLWVLP
jgi:leader peptidase (prepilin peptidase) / N-methyltransferase